MPETRSTSEAMVAQVMAEMSQKMNQIVAQIIAEMSQKMTQIVQTQSENRAHFTGMLEEQRGEMQELKLSQAKADGQNDAEEKSSSDQHQYVSPSTKPDLIFEDTTMIVAGVNGEDLDGIDFDLDIHSDLVLAKPSDVPEEEVSFSHMRSDFSSESVLNETEVVVWKEIQGFAKSICVSNCNLSICSHGVCQNASMDYSSYFMRRTNSDSYILVPEMKADDLSVLLRNMNDFNEVESSLVCRLQLRTWIKGVQWGPYVKFVDGNYVFDKGKVHKYSKQNDIDVPMFDSNELENWLFQLNLYFECYLVPIEQKLAIACLHMTGLAMTWYRWMFRHGKLVSWSSFISAIRQRFGPSSFEDLHDQLSKLSRIGIISEIVTAFESLADQVLDVRESILINMFISGLKAEIKRELLMAQPRSLFFAFELARAQEAKFKNLGGLLKVSSMRPNDSNSSVASSDKSYMHGKLPTKVFLVDFSLDLGLQNTEVVKEIDGYKFGVPTCVRSRSINFCPHGVCRIIHETSRLHSEILGELNEGYDILYGSEELLVIWLHKPPSLPPENVLKTERYFEERKFSDLVSSLKDDLYPEEVRTRKPKLIAASISLCATEAEMISKDVLVELLRTLFLQDNLVKVTISELELQLRITDQFNVLYKPLGESIVESSRKLSKTSFVEPALGSLPFSSWHGKIDDNDIGGNNKMLIGGATARGVIESVVLVFLENIPEGLILRQLKASTKIIWKGTFEVTYKFVLEAEITMKRLPTLAESTEEMIYITELCDNGSGSLWDQSKPIHVLKSSLDRLKGLVMLALETAFFILGFILSLDDHAILVRYITKFIMFSLPRPPEVGDLEDKVNFKAEGMLHIQISISLGT